MLLQTWPAFFYESTFSEVFFPNHAWKLRVQLIHECGLYTSVYSNSICLQPCMNLVILYSTSTGACSLHVNIIGRISYSVNCTKSWGKVSYVHGQEYLNYIVHVKLCFFVLVSHELMVSMMMWVPDICTCTCKSEFYQLLERILPTPYYYITMINMVF